MRADHAVTGLRVVVTGGKHKGRTGTIGAVRIQQFAAGVGFQAARMSTVNVALDGGAEIQAMPRWLESLEAPDV